jgi:hypothetical protein
MLSVIEMLLLFVQLLNFDGFILSNRANYDKQPEALPDRINEVTKLYAQACKEVANEAGVPVIGYGLSFSKHKTGARLISCQCKIIPKSRKKTMCLD